MTPPSATSRAKASSSSKPRTPSAAKPRAGSSSKSRSPSGTKASENDARTSRNALAGLAATWVLHAMKDPAFREKVAEKGKAGAGAALAWQKSLKANKAVKRRAKQHGEPDEERDLLDALKKRPRQVRKLRRAIKESVSHDADLAEPAKPFLTRLKKLDARIATAEAMSKDLRKVQYKAIDDDLDRFEVDLLTDFFGPVLEREL